MNTNNSRAMQRRTTIGAFAGAVALCAGLALADNVKVKLTGAEEVPAVTTTATGAGTIVIGSDKAVSGSIKTTGIEGIAAHIHQAAPGKNGPPIITLTKGADGEWTVPAGAMLTDAQLASYTAGELYVNVHSPANKGGEIRAQLKPGK
jgi:CHRD domain